MFKSWFLCFFVLFSFFAHQAFAEDRVLKFPVKHALNSKTGKEKMLDDVRVYMVGQGHPGVDRSYREYQSNKRSTGRSDQAACDQAFLSAIIGLQQRATFLARPTKHFGTFRPTKD